MKPVKCCCGEDAVLTWSRIYDDSGDYDRGPFWVVCSRDEEQCWSGPAKPTGAEAVEAWDKVMENRQTPNKNVKPPEYRKVRES